MTFMFFGTFQTASTDDSVLLRSHATHQSVPQPTQPGSVQMCRHFALGCVLGVLVLAAQVGPARAYDCTSHAECQYDGCHDVSCACSSSHSESSDCVNGFWTGYSTCNYGVWDAICVSTTYISTTKQAQDLWG